MPETGSELYNSNMTVPEIKLNNGMAVPAIGFGTCKHSFTEPIDDVISKALDVGYRYFDTASFYATEKDLGRAIARSSVKRSEITVATKLWYEELGYKNTKEAFSRSLDRLGLDYVDIYMIHWPKASSDDKNWKRTLLETWTAMEELKEQGLIRALGVSNFLPHHLEVILGESKEIPVVDQLELHLGYFQEYAVDYLKKHNIQPQAWSPIGRGRENFKVNTILNGFASKYGVSVQKLSLGFLIQRGIMPLPWTMSEQHMKENLNSFDFDICQEDISMLSCMPQETWLGEHPDFYLPLAKHLSTTD